MTAAQQPMRFTNKAPRQVFHPFVVDGTDLNGNPWEETFTALPEAPAGILDSFASMVSIDEYGNQVWNRMAIMKFLVGVVIPDDEHRIQQLMTDKSKLVQLDTLGEIVKALSEVYTGRPTGAPVPSMPGAAAQPDGSWGPGGSPAPTLPPPAQL